MTPYLDSNFLVRVFVRMPGSDDAVTALESLRRRRGEKRVSVAWLHRLEVVNAFQQLVFLSRQGTGVRITPEQASVALAWFEEQVDDGTYFVSAAIAPEELTVRARELSLRHTAKQGLRAYDVAHVAAALLLGCDEFWSFDVKASRLASLEGLKVL